MGGGHVGHRLRHDTRRHAREGTCGKQSTGSLERPRRLWSMPFSCCCWCSRQHQPSASCCLVCRWTISCNYAASIPADAVVSASCLPGGSMVEFRLPKPSRVEKG